MLSYWALPPTSVLEEEMASRNVFIFFSRLIPKYISVLGVVVVDVHEDNMDLGNNLVYMSLGNRFIYFII